MKNLDNLWYVFSTKERLFISYPNLFGVVVPVQCSDRKIPHYLVPFFLMFRTVKPTKCETTTYHTRVIKCPIRSGLVSLSPPSFYVSITTKLPAIRWIALCDPTSLSQNRQHFLCGDNPRSVQAGGGGGRVPDQHRIQSHAYLEELGQ